MKLLWGSKHSSFLQCVLLILVVTWGRCELTALIHFRHCQGIELEVGTNPEMISSYRSHQQVWNQLGHCAQRWSSHPCFSGQVNTHLNALLLFACRSVPYLGDSRTTLHPERLSVSSVWHGMQQHLSLENTWVFLWLSAVQISCFTLLGLYFREGKKVSGFPDHLLHILASVLSLLCVVSVCLVCESTRQRCFRSSSVLYFTGH